MHLIIFFSFLIISSLSAQTIAEKKASLSATGSDLSPETEKFLQEVNREIKESKQEEKALQEEAYQLYQEGAKEDEYLPLIEKMKELRAYISTLESSFREMASQQVGKEGYALWYQPEVTLEQLILDYGSDDYVYLIKKEIGDIKISIDSNLPIPRASWPEMLTLILEQNGVGVRQLNPFLRELYFLRTDRSSIKMMTNKREDLEFLSPDTRVAFLLTPELSEVRRTFFFLENFANPETTVVQLIGRDILLVAKSASISDLLRLYDFISTNKGDKEYKAITLGKVKADEMAKVLRALFNQSETGGRALKSPEIINTKEGKGVKLSPQQGSLSTLDGNGLQVMTLGTGSQTLFLIGTKEEIKKAEEVIREVESQMGGARDKVVFWYTLKHSNPEETADVLSKVYDLMVKTGADIKGEGILDINAPKGGNFDSSQRGIEQKTVIEQRPSDRPFADEVAFGADPYFLQPVFPISPSYVFPASNSSPKPNIDKGNFIVDLKTGSIVMVVEADLLPKIKELLKKLDVPKKMVQLEVLFFEKKIAKQNNFGLNMLRLGSAAKNVTAASAIFNPLTSSGAPTGIFDFLWSHERTCSSPAFDLSYRFLLSQEDVTINAAPSVLTVNQTPAFISIQEEISINTGIVELPTTNGVTLKDAYQRAQYGITLKITPTIHQGDDEEDLDTISLDSDITFDTFDTLVGANNQQPNITRRNVKNEARVADGETVIIGGLRKKTAEDSKDSIPFIGELPGFGKLFSETTMRDNSTEMFIFITPKIVVDPACDLERIRQEEMMRRPGDVPEFMQLLVEAEEAEKNRLFDGWLQTLFGRDRPRLLTPSWQDNDTCGTNASLNSCGEYDGR